MSDGRLKIPYPVIVEGRFDALRLESVIDAEIITTDGFGIFKNAEKKALLAALAAKTPLIVLTDPDGAGGVIRSHLSGTLPPDRVIRLYAPRIEGTEKRKKSPSAEGVLGIEGIDRALLRDLFLPFSDTCAAHDRGGITAAMLASDGFTGCAGAAERRDAAGGSLGLPPGMNAKAFLSALNLMLSPFEYRDLAARFGCGRDG